MSCEACNKVKNIITGNYNNIFRDEDIEKIALPRLEICKTCTFVREMMKVNGKSVLQCSKCKCPCNTKTRVPEEKCPEGLW